MTHSRWLLLALALVLGAILRFESLGQPCFWLDEILGATLTKSAIVQPASHWITGVDREHGPLYYATQLASHDEFTGRLPAALFGLCTIPLVWLAAQKNAIAALLLAASPLHVYYSREARPYALLMLLTATLVVALLREARPLVVGAILLALLYTSATAGPVIAACAVTTLLVARKRLLAIAAVATLLVPLLYRGKPWAISTHDFPPLDLRFFSRVLHALTVSAFGDDIRGRTALVLLVFAIVGAIVLARRDRHSAIVIIAMTVLPAIFAIAPLWYSGHFFATRYLSPSLIGFVVLAGAGIAACRPQLLALAITAAVLTQTWDTSRREPYQKLDWRLIAQTLREHARPGDVIATAESYSYISLQYYLDAPGVHFVQLDSVPLAERWTRGAPATFLVTAGYSTDVSRWMCRFPLLLASPLEGFRLHYAHDFLAERSTLAEQRAVAMALTPTFEMGPEDDLVL
ncbi:MAG TPA: hypothetical protein VJZ00_13400, partial [Thermoanaerobaculia bacterium]|nr:hypothetical protein [Thermoanaerobaculia bacterium]